MITTRLNRAWFVTRLPDGHWIGRTGGRLPIEARCTEAGPLDQVMHAIKHPDVRRGLPIVVEAQHG
jgi:hypothetical protein